MIIDKLDSKKSGWFIGDFSPSVLKTDQFEVGILDHKAGEKSDYHYHKVTTEYNLIIKGKLIISNVLTLSDRDIFIFEPGEKTNITFLEDTTLIVIKVPSLPKDKYY